MLALGGEKAKDDNKLIKIETDKGTVFGYDIYRKTDIVDTAPDDTVKLSSASMKSNDNARQLPKRKQSDVTSNTSIAINTSKKRQKRRKKPLLVQKHPIR